MLSNFDIKSDYETYDFIQHKFTDEQRKKGDLGEVFVLDCVKSVIPWILLKLGLVIKAAHTVGKGIDLSAWFRGIMIWAIEIKNWSPQKKPYGYNLLIENCFSRFDGVLTNNRAIFISWINLLSRPFINKLREKHIAIFQFGELTRDNYQETLKKFVSLNFRDLFKFLRIDQLIGQLDTKYQLIANKLLRQIRRLFGVVQSIPISLSVVKQHTTNINKTDNTTHYTTDRTKKTTQNKSKIHKKQSALNKQFQQRTLAIPNQF